MKGGSYYEKLQSPRWQRKRLTILRERKWECEYNVKPLLGLPAVTDKKDNHVDPLDCYPSIFVKRM